MLHDLALFIQAKDVYASPVLVRVGGPLLMAMKHDEVALRHGALDMNTLTWEIDRHALEVGNKGLLAIADVRVVLFVLFDPAPLSRTPG
jgi:hypothetical protein